MAFFFFNNKAKKTKCETCYSEKVGIFASHIFFNKILCICLSKAHDIGTGGTEVVVIDKGVGCGIRLGFGGRAAALVLLSFVSVLSLLVLLLFLLETARWKWEIIRGIISRAFVFGGRAGGAASQIVYI